MTEYIGARITLISKSDIRYSGILHEINSENSTVALENVISFGTEGRRSGEDEVPPSDHTYDYIVFRGSDVKDLKIEQQPAKETKPQPPAMPNDPAILGAARPPQAPQQQAQQPPPPQGPQGQGPRPQPNQGFGPGPYPPQYPPYPPFGGRGFGPQGGFPGGPGGPGGPAGFPGYPGYPPYGPPPGWQGGPNQGFPPMGPNQFSSPPPLAPIGAPGAQPGPQPPQGPKGSQAPPSGPAANKEEKPKVAEADGAPKPAEPKPASQAATPAPTAPKKAPTPPVESKPDVAAALAAPAPTVKVAQTTPGQKPVPTGPKSGRIVPAVPLSSPGPRPAAQPVTATPPANGSSAGVAQPGKAAAVQSYQNATQAATAAVAAAMAKLKPQQATAGGDAAVDNLTRKVAEMRADDKIRHSKSPGTGGYATGNRGGARGGRGGVRHGHQHHGPKMEVPTTDFDFETSNAKFNKKDLVKEAIATGSPLGETPTAPPNGSVPEPNGESKAEEVVIPGADHKSYDKTTSFFDNISSELRDREDAKKLGGQEFRSEERKKNLETFGQGSVDGYRGGYRGRGFRGRGRGRGFSRGRGRGGQPGWAPRGGAQAGQPAELS